MLTKTIVSGKNGQLAVFKTEKRKKQALVCVHGGPGLDHTSLLPGLLELQKIFDLVFVDLHGHGASRDINTEEYSVKSFVQDVFDITALVKEYKTIGIFGHSFGGNVAMSALAHQDNCFDFGILCTVPLDTRWQDYVEKTAGTLANPTALEIETMFAKSKKADKDFLVMTQEYAGLYFPEIDSEKAKKIIRSWGFSVLPYLDACQNHFATMDYKTDCTNIHAPCLVIGAEKDLIIPLEQIEAQTRLISKADQVVIEKAGHFPFLTETQQFLDVVNQWRDELDIS